MEVTWDTAYAADTPISHYEILRDGKMIASVTHSPQITTEPFRFKDKKKGATYAVVTVDMNGDRAESEKLT